MYVLILPLSYAYRLLLWSQTASLVDMLIII